MFFFGEEGRGCTVFFFQIFFFKSFFEGVFMVFFQVFFFFKKKVFFDNFCHFLKVFKVLVFFEVF